MLRGVLILGAVMVHLPSSITASASSPWRGCCCGRAAWTRGGPCGIFYGLPPIAGWNLKKCRIRCEIDESNGCKLHVAGWWIGNPDARGRFAVILHGYSDAKVGGIAWRLAAAGAGVCDIGHRPCARRQRRGLLHGRILGAAGCQSGAGSVEGRPTGRDPANLIVWDQPRRGGGGRGDGGIAKRSWAVILECPFSSFHNAAKRHGTRIGTPGPFFQEPAFALAKWMSGADMDAVRPVDTIPKISCPVMVIQSCDDPFLSDEDRAAVRQALESRGHRKPPAFAGNCPIRITSWECGKIRWNIRRIEDFLSRVLQNTVAVCDK